jgi:two-component system, NarL family, sensor histidine kinase BarA
MGDKSVQTKSRSNNNRDVGDARVAHLIEQLKQRSSELEEANRELRSVSQYRSLFLARMSHELRTPLTSILGFTEILLDQEQLTDPQRRFCQKIRTSGMQLLTSLNQLVDLSRLEVGPAELFLQEFPLNETMREACAAVDRFAHKQEINLDYDIAEDVANVVSDQGRLRQVLYTFLGWSVSRSKEGQAVKAFARLSGPMLVIQIDDQGPPVRDMSRVFEPEQSQPGGRTDLNAMGIIIGRRLLEVMKGTVRLENLESDGLRTTLEIPVGQPK